MMDRQQGNLPHGNLYFQYRDTSDNLNKVFIETETKNQITYADLEQHSAAYSTQKLGLTGIELPCRLTNL